MSKLDRPFRRRWVQHPPDIHYPKKGWKGFRK